MSTTLFVGLVASAALVVGSVIGTFVRVPQRIGGLAMAVGAGSLMSAATLELLQPALSGSGVWASAGWFAGGALTFIVVDAWLDRYADPTRDEFGHDRTYGFLLVGAVVLDGVPENVALGLTGEGGGIGLGVAIVLSNLPEAMVGSRSARVADMRPGLIVFVWTAAAALLFAAVVAGTRISGASASSTGPWLAFAGGAVVAAIADALIPGAVERSGTVSALGVALGFLLGSILGT